MSETALAVLEKSPEGETPSALMRRATDVAGVCREIVMRTAMDLQGKKYVKVEGWMSIAAAYGCVPSIREVAEEERGIRAVAELRRHDGTVIASAEGFCGLDEPRWANQPLYARRGMAQTRAISRVCRSVFAFCVVLIDENLSTTPAEEIPAGGEVLEAAPVHAPARASRRPGVPPPPADSPLVPYGKNKGQRVSEISDKDLEWLAGAAKKSADANDPKWGKANKEFLAKVQEELARRAFGSEATGKVVAPADASARQAQLSVEEEIVTPTQRLFRLKSKYGLADAKFASVAKGATGKDGGYTHEEIDRIQAAIETMAGALGLSK